MTLDIIILHTLNVITLTIAMIIFQFVWKYLNKKALGMQTVFDHMIKDLIRIHISRWLSEQLINPPPPVRTMKPILAP